MITAYVNPWWTKLTRYDKEFLPHINRILVHVVHVIEERAHNVQLSSLAFHDLPTIITQHYVDFRNIQPKLSTSYATGGAASLSHLFAQIQPHTAISSDGKIDPEYYRQVVDTILKLCLPTEDYEPEVERVIIREVLVKVLVNDIIPKITQPWFIQKTILDLLGPIEEEFYGSSRSSQPASNDTSFFHSMVIIILSALQSFSGACLAFMHAYKQAISTIKLVNQTPSQPSKDSTSSQHSATDIQPTKVAQPTQAPPVASSSSSSSTTSVNLPSDGIPTVSPVPPPSQQVQDYAIAPLRMLTEIINAHERYASTLFLSTLSMTASSMTPFLDKLLPYLLQRFLSPSFVLNTTRLSKRTLFPNGYPGPPPIIPTPEEQAEIRAKIVAWRGKGPISHLLPIILGSDPSATLGAALDPLSDADCNARLFVFILDRLLLTLFPELVA
ncbi:hypothetical protein H1R20_g8341, partial [Candolleomyces eurysporus]